MDILRHSLVGRCLAGLKIWVSNSRIISLLRAGVHSSALLSPFMRERVWFERFIKSSLIIPTMSTKKTEPARVREKEKKTPNGWLWNSYFIRSVWTWKDCEDDDKTFR